MQTALSVKQRYFPSDDATPYHARNHSAMLIPCDQNPKASVRSSKTPKTTGRRTVRIYQDGIHKFKDKKNYKEIQMPPPYGWERTLKESEAIQYLREISEAQGETHTSEEKFTESMIKTFINIDKDKEKRYTTMSQPQSPSPSRETDYQKKVNYHLSLLKKSRNRPQFRKSHIETIDVQPQFQCNYIPIKQKSRLIDIPEHLVAHMQQNKFRPGTGMSKNGRPESNAPAVQGSKGVSGNTSIQSIDVNQGSRSKMSPHSSLMIFDQDFIQGGKQGSQWLQQQKNTETLTTQPKEGPSKQEFIDYSSKYYGNLLKNFRATPQPEKKEFKKIKLPNPVHADSQRKMYRTLYNFAGRFNTFEVPPKEDDFQFEKAYKYSGKSSNVQTTQRELKEEKKQKLAVSGLSVKQQNKLLNLSKVQRSTPSPKRSNKPKINSLNLSAIYNPLESSIDVPKSKGKSPKIDIADLTTRRAQYSPKPAQKRNSSPKVHLIRNRIGLQSTYQDDLLGKARNNL